MLKGIAARKKYFNEVLRFFIQAAMEFFLKTANL